MNRIDMNAKGAKDAIRDASASEMRLLLLLLAGAKREELAALADTSEGRVASALKTWEDAGVLPSDGNVTFEYEERVRAGEVAEETSAKVAGTIKNEELANLIEACADLLGKPALNDTEIKDIVGLYSQYSLSEEYILTLFGDIVSRNKRPSTKLLISAAAKQIERGNLTVEALNAFLKRRDETASYEYVLRKITGIYDRTFSDKEKALFERWCVEYAFGEPILRLAYSKAAEAHPTNFKFSYMGAILDGWHTAGCKTVTACEEESERHKSALSGTSKSKPEQPRFGTFDPEEAFRAAVERSFADVSDKTPEKEK